MRPDWDAEEEHYSTIILHHIYFDILWSKEMKEDERGFYKNLGINNALLHSLVIVFASQTLNIVYLITVSVRFYFQRSGRYGELLGVSARASKAL